jgi:HEAT repeat protein
LSNPLLERLRDPSPQVRAEACRAVPDDPSAVLFLDELAQALADPAREVGRAASDALVTLAEAHPEVHDLLRRLLHEDDPRLRFRAAYVKSRLGPPEPVLLPALVEAFAARDSDVRWAAVRIFVDLGRLHEQALPLALGLARTSELPVVRRTALFCLRELAPDEPSVAETFVEASRDDDRAVRRAALTCMPALLSPDAAVSRRLLEVLADEKDPAARRLAAIALGELLARNPCAQARAALEKVANQASNPDLVQAALRGLERAGQARTRLHSSELG